jgi:hypothetical protein
VTASGGGSGCSSSSNGGCISSTAVGAAKEGGTVVAVPGDGEEGREQRLHPATAAGEGEGGREQRREGRESREEGGEQQGAGWRWLPFVSLSSLFIGGGWLGLRGGCSWAS